jgi:hypothetical protein
MAAEPWPHLGEVLGACWLDTEHVLVLCPGGQGQVLARIADATRVLSSRSMDIGALRGVEASGGGATVVVYRRGDQGLAYALVDAAAGSWGAGQVLEDGRKGARGAPAVYAGYEGVGLLYARDGDLVYRDLRDGAWSEAAPVVGTAGAGHASLGSRTERLLLGAFEHR